MTIFKGAGVAIVTPFNADGSVNFDCYERLINRQIENGIDAIITCGTTGEASTLSEDEQLEVIKAAVDFTKKRVPVIAGTGSNCTEHSIQLSKGAEKAGADGLLIVTPYYNKTSQKGLVAHYEAIAASVGLPIVLYSVPARTSISILPKTAQQLSNVENIVAIKEASSNIVQIAEIAERCEGKLDIYAGNDDHVVPVLSLGGKGVISTVANVAPKQVHDMVEAFFNKDLETALKLQLGINGLVRALFMEVSPMPVKAALNMMGLDVGKCRLPLVDVEDSCAEVLRQELMRYGMI